MRGTRLLALLAITLAAALHPSVVAAAIPPAPADDVTVSTSARTVEAAPGALDLAKVLDLAMRQSALIEAAMAGTEVFEARVAQADSFQYPRVKLDSMVGPTPAKRGTPEDGWTDMSEWGVLASVELTGYVPLYGFSKIRHLKKAARLGVEVGKALEDIARAEVRYRVMKGYFDLALARELQSVMAEGRGYFNTAKRHVETTKAEDDPSFDPIDEMKIRVYDAQVQGRELESIRQRAQALGGLRQAFGEDPQSGPDVLTPPLEALTPLREVTLDQAIDAAVQERTDLVALRLGVKARGAEARARYWAMYPDFVLAGQFSFHYSNVADAQHSPFASNPYNGWSAGGGLALRWDMDLARKLGELRETRANRDKLSADLADAERGVRLEVEKLFLEMRDAKTMVDAQTDALKAARGWVVSKLDLYENDLATLRDVLDGLLQFFQCRLDLLKAIHDYNVAVAALERAAGLDLVPVAAAAAGTAPGVGRE
jgi:outer membrane protein TolC